ncbi:MAG: YchJ family protein [Deltaproteobacteria bacterium]|nr:YchJ family protein [Deltaproteobacteria bacterium]
MDQCPCGSERGYAECCEPLIKGERAAETAEELLRSRYSAYSKTEVSYIVKTTHSDHLKDTDEASIRAWSENSVWEKLEVEAASAGGPDDTEGTVEFYAHYTEKGARKIHHELATFKKVDGTWYFYDAEPVRPKQYVRPEPKIGRNEPCPCGSGKKYKKCCSV